MTGAHPVQRNVVPDGCGSVVVRVHPQHLLRRAGGALTAMDGVWRTLCDAQTSRKAQGTLYEALVVHCKRGGEQPRRRLILAAPGASCCKPCRVSVTSRTPQRALQPSAAPPRTNAWPTPARARAARLRARLLAAVQRAAQVGEALEEAALGLGRAHLGRQRGRKVAEQQVLPRDRQAQQAVEEAPARVCAGTLVDFQQSHAGRPCCLPPERLLSWRSCFQSP